METEASLSQLWDRYYAHEILGRLDLSREYSFVRDNGSMRLLDVLEHINRSYDDGSIEDMDESVRAILASIDILPEEDRTLIPFNLLPLLIECIRTGDSESLVRIGDIINNPTWDLLRDIPPKVIIEITNNCNLSCKMCGVGSLPYSAERTMDIELFEHIIEDVREHANLVRLNGLGETTIVPGILDYLAIIDGSGVQTELITNLSTSDGEVLDRILSMDMTLIISCDSPDPSHLANIRRGLDADTFFQNLASIRDTKDRNPQQNIIIFTILEENYKELPEMVKLASEYNMSSVIGNMVKGANGKWKRQQLNDLKEIFSRAHEQAESLGMGLKVPSSIEGTPLNLDFTSTTNDLICNTFLDECFIRYNGDVCPCNMMNPYILGNICRNDLVKIINSRNAQIFGSLMKSKLRTPYCEFCYYMQ